MTVANRFPMRITSESRVVGQTCLLRGLLALAHPPTSARATHLCYLHGFRKRLSLQPVLQGGEGPEKSYSKESCLTSLSPGFCTMTALQVASSPHPFTEPLGRCCYARALSSPRGCSLDRVLPVQRVLALVTSAPIWDCPSHQAGICLLRASCLWAWFPEPSVSTAP